MEQKMGAKITALRKARGMTQEQLAAALGVSGPAVSKWETWALGNGQFLSGYYAALSAGPSLGHQCGYSAVV